MSFRAWRPDERQAEEKDQTDADREDSQHDSSPRPDPNHGAEILGLSGAVQVHHGVISPSVNLLEN